MGEEIKNKILELSRCGNTIKEILGILQEEGLIEKTIKLSTFYYNLRLDNEFYKQILIAQKDGRIYKKQEKIAGGSEIIQIIIKERSEGKTYKEIAEKYPEIFPDEVAVNRAYRKYIKPYPELLEKLDKKTKEHGREVRIKINIIVDGILRKKNLAIIFSENPNIWSNVEELEKFYLENRSQIENLVKCTRFPEESGER